MTNHNLRLQVRGFPWAEDLSTYAMLISSMPTKEEIADVQAAFLLLLGFGCKQEAQYSLPAHGDSRSLGRTQMMRKIGRLALGSYGSPFLVCVATTSVWQMTASGGHAAVCSSVFIHHVQFCILSMSFIG